MREPKEEDGKKQVPPQKFQHEKQIQTATVGVLDCLVFPHFEKDLSMFPILFRTILFDLVPKRAGRHFRWYGLNSTSIFAEVEVPWTSMGIYGYPLDICGYF